MSFRRLLVPVLCAAAALHCAATPVVRIKDIATIRGIRANQMLGLGLLTGLAGQGDSSSSALLKSSLSAVIASFGVTVSPQDIRSRNCAVVMVSAELPSFARAGDSIDVTVSSIGDARSLDGGVLLQTNLQAANGKVYAVAQGRVLSSADPGGVRTVGAIPGGAIVEKEALSEFVDNNRVSVVLRNPDFVTASAIQKAVETAFPGIQATSRDPSLIEIQIPQDRAANPVGFLAQMEALTLTPDTAGRVVINATSGVIVMGEKVRIGKVAVSYKSSRVSVGTAARGSSSDQPDLFLVGDTTTVDDFVTTLKGVGLKTDVIIGILQAVERAGALFGSLVIM